MQEVALLRLFRIARLARAARHSFFFVCIIVGGRVKVDFFLNFASLKKKTRVSSQNRKGVIFESSSYGFGCVMKVAWKGLCTCHQSSAR